MKRLSMIVLALMLFMAPFARAEEETVPELMEPVGVKMDSEPVRRGAISQIIYYEGAVVAQSHETYFTVDGRIKEVYARLGQSVKKGDVLMTLNEEELEEQLQRLRDQIDYQSQQNEYECALRQIDIDIQNIDLMRMMDERADPQAIRLLEEDIRMMTAELRQLREAQSLAIETLWDELSAIEGKLGHDEIVAPCDGRVVYLKGLDEGDWVSAYETLICVTDDSSLLIDTQLVSDSMLAYSDHYYALVGDGRYEIEMIPTDWQENIVISLEGGELRSKFHILTPDERTEAGQYACVCLVTKYVEDTLIIPVNALNTDITGRFVYVDDEGARVRRAVKVGAMTDIEVEIVEGLAEGDVVYVKD